MKRLISLFSVAVLVALATPAVADFTATGTFLYEDLPIDINGFQSPHPSRPCRFVDVRVIDNTTQAIIGLGATDANGYFSISCIDATVRHVAILALTQSGNVTNLNYYVSNWSSTAVHAFQGTVVLAHDPTVNIDMGEVTMHYRAGAEAFNIYDVHYEANDLVGSLEGGIRPSAYQIRYTLDYHNDQAYCSGGIQYIGGNFGYDDTIILHETGHIICGKYGNFSDSPGGSHYFEDNAQDPRLSFGEAFPTFFSSNVRDWVGYSHPNVYLNSTGDSTTGVISFSYNLEDPPSGIGIGAASEVGVQAAMWDITDGDATADFTPGVDDEPGYQMNRTFAEAWSFIRTYLSQPPFSGTLTYEDFHELWVANVVPPQATELVALEDLNGIQYRDDAYEAGGDDTSGHPGLYHTFEDIGLARRTHHTTWPVLDEDWVMFEGLAGITYQINTMTMRDGADTYMEVQNAAHAVLASNDNAGTPDPGTYNTFELLRSTISYLPTTTQDLYVRVRRSPTSPWGVASKYGNWDLKIQATSVPATYPNLTTAPPTTATVSLQQNTTQEMNLVIGNTGTVDILDFTVTEGSTPISWVSVSPLAGSVAPAGTSTSIMTFDATGLDVGFYTDSLEVHCNDPDRPLKYLKLNLTVTEVVAVGEIDGAPATWLGESSPNPANPETAIRYSLATAGHARLGIYDVQGREVVTLVDGNRPAGEQMARWDGRDRNRQSVPSGVYFYRLDSKGRSESRRMVVTR